MAIKIGQKIRQTLSVVAGFTLLTVSHITGAEMTRISDDVYHFVEDGYSSLVVVGADGILITDPASPARSEVLRDELAEITDLDVRWTVLSHEHYDHIGGTEIFPEADVICQSACENVIAVSPILAEFDIDSAFRNAVTLDLGSDLQIEIIHVAPADGVATSIVNIPSRGVVYSADLYVRDAFGFVEFLEDVNFVGLRDTLNRLVRMNPSYAISTHIDDNSVQALNENAALINSLYDAVMAYLEPSVSQGGIGAAIGSAVFGGIFGPVPFPQNVVNELDMDLAPYADWERRDEAYPVYVQRMVLSIVHGG